MACLTLSSFHGCTHACREFIILLDGCHRCMFSLFSWENKLVIMSEFMLGGRITSRQNWVDEYINHTERRIHNQTNSNLLEQIRTMIACQTVSMARAMPVRQTVASRVAGIRMPGSLMVCVDSSMYIRIFLVEFNMKTVYSWRECDIVHVSLCGRFL